MSYFEECVSKYIKDDLERYNVVCDEAKASVEKYFASIVESRRAELLEQAKIKINNIYENEGGTDSYVPLSEGKRKELLDNAKMEIEEQLERERAEHINNAVAMITPPVTESEARSIMAFLNTENNYNEPVPIIPDFHKMVYQLGDRYWSVEDARFIDAPPEGADIVEIVGEQTIENLRSVLSFYKRTTQPWIVIGNELLPAPLCNLDSVDEIRARLRELDAQYLTPRVLAGISLGDAYAGEQWLKHEEEARPLRLALAKLEDDPGNNDGGKSPEKESS